MPTKEQQALLDIIEQIPEGERVEIMGLALNTSRLFSEAMAALSALAARSPTLAAAHIHMLEKLIAKMNAGIEGS